MTDNKRRNPKQGRAKATVEAILGASLHILEEEGEARLTTNHIAEKAGVSIGTLYQYFSGRDEILAELGERRANETRNRIAQIVTQSPETGSVRAIVEALLDTGPDRPETRAVLTDALFRVRGEGILGAHHLAFLDSISGRPEFSFPLSAEAAFVLTHAPISLLRSAQAEPELALDRDRLADELVRLLESYLGALSARAES